MNSKLILSIKIIIIYIWLIEETHSIIRASLLLTNYDPPIFQLSFSQPIPLPMFQILVNNNNLQYDLHTNSTSATMYQFQVTSDIEQIDTQHTFSYSLVFNQPLNIEGGTLDVADFILIPEKQSYLYEMSQWIAHVLYGLVFITSLCGIVGLWVIDFIQIYVLVESKFRYQSTFIRELTIEFLFDKQGTTYQGYAYTRRLATPIMFAFGVFIFCTVMKLLFRKLNNQTLGKRLTKFFSYNLFLTVWTILLPSVIFKAVQHMTSQTITLELSQTQKIICDFVTYLNVLYILSYFYTLYLILNPKINQQTQSFRAYMLSSEFKLYQKFHKGLHLRNWFKRNLTLWITIRKLIIIVLYFLVDEISIYVLFLELGVLFFIFTTRPYKQQLYTNLSIIFNLMFTFFFIFIIEGTFFFDLSQILQTRTSLSSFLLTKNIIFIIICFIGIIFALVEAYRDFNDMKYEIQQQRQYQKVKQEVVPTTRCRLYTESSDSKLDMKQSLIFDSPAPSSPGIRKNSKKDVSHTSSKAKLSLFEVQLQQISSPNAIRKRASSTRVNKKWKDKSLFQQLAVNGDNK